MAYHSLAHGLEKHTSGPTDVSETSPASHAFPERFRGTLNPFYRSIKTVSENIECGDKGHTPFLLRVTHLICPCPPMTLVSVPSPAVVGPQQNHLTFPPVTENQKMSAHITPPVKVSSSYVPPNDSPQPRLFRFSSAPPKNEPCLIQIEYLNYVSKFSMHADPLTSFISSKNAATR